MSGNGLATYKPTVGSYEDAVSYIERPDFERRGDVEVNWTTIRIFCVAVEDGNLSYWDSAFADSQWGGIIAPPAMLMAWVARLPWAPDGEASAPVPLTLTVPLPGTAIVNISNVTEYFAQLHIGDHVTANDVIESISPLKRTAAGDGHFVTTRSVYTRQDGTVVAVERNTLLRYIPREALA
jgi:N-terminal half of MaoC dehydratase